VTVTGVDITPDLRHARVFVSVLGTEEGLLSLAGHLRARLAKSLQLRVAPELQFKEDDTVARAARIESLLAEIKRKETPGPSGGEESGS
jgi:ribosome-binding factor A